MLRIKKVCGHRWFSWSSNEPFILPQIEDGLEYATNWGLNAIGVTPYGKAYGNASVDKIGEFIIKDDDISMHETPLDMEIERANEMNHKIRKDLSSSPVLFSQTGVLGTFSLDRSSIRLVTDDPIVAQWASYLLVSIKTPPKDKVPTISVFVKQSSTLTQAAYSQNEEGKVSISIRGRPTAQHLIDLLGKGKQELIRSDAVMLPATVLCHYDHTALVINARSNDSMDNDTVHSGHQCIWSNEGLTGVFSGRVVPAAVGVSSQLLPVTPTTSLAHCPCHNIVSHPSFIFLLNEDDNIALSPLSSTTFVQHLHEHESIQNKTSILKSLIASTPIYTGSSLSMIKSLWQ